MTNQQEWNSAAMEHHKPTKPEGPAVEKWMEDSANECAEIVAEWKVPRAIANGFYGVILRHYSTREGPAQEPQHDQDCGCAKCFVAAEGKYAWRIGRKVPINVYEGDRPVCQCQTALDAKKIVAAVNAAMRQDHATPAPSQPAGAREVARNIAAGILDRLQTRHGDVVLWIQGQVQAYARQQTAAKDAELKKATQRIAELEEFWRDKNEQWEAAERDRNSLREANARLAADLDAALRPAGSRTAEQYRAALIIAAQKRLATITQCPNCNSSDRAKDVTGSHHDSSGMDIHLDRCEHPWHNVRYEDDSYEMLSMGLPNYPQFDKGWVKEMQKAAFQYELAALKAGKESHGA